MKLKLDTYMEDRLIALSKELYPNEPDDTIAIGLLINEHKAFREIVDITRRF